VFAITSLPAGERGLKSLGDFLGKVLQPVAPRRGAWIEIEVAFGKQSPLSSRSPQGSVD